MYTRLALLLTAVSLSALCAQDSLLQKSLKDVDVQGAWIYNDLPAGYAEAKKTGKPLLVVFR